MSSTSDQPAARRDRTALRVLAAAVTLAAIAPLGFALPVGGYWARVAVGAIAGALFGVAAMPLATPRLVDRLTAALPITWMVGAAGWLMGL